MSKANTNNTPKPVTTKTKGKPAVTSKKKRQAATPGANRMRVADVVVGLTAVVLIISGLVVHANRDQGRSSLVCNEPGIAHQVNLAGDSFSPNQLDVKRCDLIVVSNSGDQEYDLAFGTHENLVGYPGFSRQLLSPGEYFELTATKTGTHTLHDHAANKAYLELRVSN